MSRVLLVEKKFSYEKDGKKLSFLKTYGKIEKVIVNLDGKEEVKVKWFEIGFKKEVRDALTKEMAKKDLSFPVAIEVGDTQDDYFIVPQTYVDKDGVEKEGTPKLIVLNYSNLEEAPQLEKESKNRINIEDYFN